MLAELFTIMLRQLIDSGARTVEDLQSELDTTRAHPEGHVLEEAWVQALQHVIASRQVPNFMNMSGRV